MITTFHKVRHLFLFLVGMGFIATAAQAAVPVIDSSLTDSAEVGSPYSYDITTVVDDNNFYQVTGALPSGLTLNSTSGEISGTPTEDGVFLTTIRAFNDDGDDSQPFTLTVTYPLPVITSSLSANGREGDPFSYQIVADNEPTSYDIAGLNTITGLSFDPATGEISGTPAVNGSYGLLITATNGAGSDSEVLDLVIDPPLSEPPVITSSLTEAEFVGAFFSYEITATNSPTSYSTIGTLPAGVTLSGSTLSGTLTEDGVTTFTVVAENAIGVGQADVTLTVTYDAPVLDLSGLPDGRVGDPFAYSIEATNAPTSYAVDGLASVGGLSIDTATGLISGIPLNAGDFDLIISATNATDTDTQLATLTVLPSLSAAPSITSSLTEQAFAGSSYTYTIVATNAPTSYGLAGVLPAGLTRNGALISGVPTETGVFTVTISASNADGTGEETLELTVVDAAPVVTSASAVVSSVGSDFTYTITATNSPTSYDVVGLDSIDGLSFDSVTGVISGIPTVPGDYDLTVIATNSAGSGNADVLVTVIDGVPVITSSLTPSGTVGDPFLYSIEATNTPTSYNVTGLDAVGGLVFDSSTGVISGIPLADGDFDLLISASNANGTDTELAVLTVLPSSSAAPAITSPLIESALSGSFYTYTIVATNSPTSYGLTGILPAGLTRSGDLISGVPTEVGVFNVTILASNASGTGEETLELTVLEALPVINSPSSAFGSVDSEFNYMITASGSPTSFAVVGLDSIDGLTFDSGTGVISGIPTVEVDTDLVVTATNGSGSDSQAVRLLIGPAIPTTGNVPPTVVITSPLSGATFDGDTTEITIEADVTPSTGETVDTVFVRWTNPPADANSPEIILVTMTAGATSGTTTSYTGTVNLGYNPNNRELGAGDVDLEVVAFQTNAVNAQDYGSDAVSFEIAPFAQFVFPAEDFTTGRIDVGDLFASVVINTNAFVSVTARISGASIVDTVVDDDDSNNPNGVFNFVASQAIDFPGEYLIEITVLDSNGVSALLERTFMLSESATGPVAVIAAPTPGFRTQVYSPALIEGRLIEGDSVPNLKDGVIESYTSTYKYNMYLISSGQGYYPRDNSDTTLLGKTTDQSVIEIEGIQIEGGRVTEVPGTMTYTYTGPSSWSGYGHAFNTVMDDPSSPGAPSRINIAAEFFKANSDLASYKIFVNGEDVTPGAGNLNINNGAIDVPLVRYPAVGSPFPGDYVVVAQVTDQDGEVAMSQPTTFSVQPYEAIDIDLSRVDETVAVQGDVVTYEIAVDPIDEIEKVEMFDSDSGDLLGEAVKQTIAGLKVFRFSQIYDQQGNFGIYAVATAFDGRVVQSAPDRVEVEALDDLEVNLILPVGDQTVIVGQSLSFEAEATSTPGVTSVSLIVDNLVVETVTSAPYQFAYLFDTVGGPYNVRVSALDNFGNSAGAAEEVNVTVIPSDVSVAITSNIEDGKVVIGETKTFSVTTLSSAGITSVEWYVNDVLTETATASPYNFSYTFGSSGVTKISAIATDSLGWTATDSLLVTVNLANPVLYDRDFVNYSYVQLTGNQPTEEHVDNALDQMDGTVDGHVAYLEALFESSDMDETEMIMMVYRTMTGEWPNAIELEVARAGALGGTAGAASQSGSIEQGGTQTFEFFYNAGDIVTVRVAADASDGDPLTDATLTINSPSGAFVAYSDDSIFGLDPLVTFTATEAGSYSAIVAGWSTFQSGDFTITSISSNSGGSSSASMTALVQSLIPEFEDRFDMTFPTTNIVSGAEATGLVEQLFKNKHGGAPDAQSWNRLHDALTGSGEALGGLTVPGYTGNLSVFTAAFALDNELSPFPGLTSVHYYGIPNHPVNDVPLALMIAMFQGEDPTEEALAEYDGMTQAEAFEDILTDPRYYEQFPPATVEAYVGIRLAELGIFDQSLNALDDDADGDGQSNLIEIALGSNPVDSSDTASNPRANIEDGTDFVVTFIRIQASEVPRDFIIYAECSADMGSWDHREDTTDVASLAADQSGVPEGYERVEIRIDMTVRPCQFIRLSIDIP